MLETLETLVQKEDNLVRGIERDKHSTHDGLRIIYESLNSLRHELIHMADDLIPTGQGVLISKMDVLRSDINMIFSDINNKIPQMQGNGLSENAGYIIEEGSSVIAQINQIENHVKINDSGAKAVSQMAILINYAERIDTGIDMTLSNSLHLYERLEMIKEVREELAEQRERSLLDPSKHIEAEVKDVNKDIKKPRGFSL